MYKCTDCGQEFDIKPNYCDCGNDTFEEITVNKSMATQESKVVTHKESTRSQSVDLPSLLIFVFCIILSVLSWIFIGRNGDKVEEVTVKTPMQDSIEIPSINELWKETKHSTFVENLKDVKAKKAEVLPKIQKKITATTPIVKAKTKTAVQTVKKVVTPTMTEQQKQEIIKKLTTKPSILQSEKDQKSTVSQKPVQPVVTSKTEPEPEPKIDYEKQKQELIDYKVALRNKIGRNINFATVIGDGNCAVTFKIDKTGNLIERNFSHQSQNNSLNDVVYSAIIQTPTFTPPPSGYKNETLTLYVKIYGGQFEVSLK